MRRIGAAWDSYQREVVPKNASTTQRWETRRAFYAGAQALFQTIINLLEPGSDATDADLRMMDEIDAELKEFANAVERGRA